VKLSLESLASPEEEGGATDKASLEIEGKATGTSATASAGAMDPVTGVSNRSPVVGGEAGLAGGTEEEETMDKVKNKKKKKKKKKRGGEERGNR
jgi:hypothetical protein